MRVRAVIEVAPVAATILALSALAGDPAPGDAWVGGAMQHMPLGSLFAAMGVFLAYPPVQFVVWFASALAALRTRNWTLFLAAFLLLAALGVNPILKEVFARPRPGADDLIIRRPASGYGFPSGHTSAATLLYGYAALSLSSVASQRIARCCTGSACIAISLIAFERVYDGAHWPSDIAGGFVLGVLLVAGCVALCDILTWRLRRHPAAIASPAQTGVARRHWLLSR